MPESVVLPEFRTRNRSRTVIPQHTGCLHLSKKIACVVGGLASWAPVLPLASGATRSPALANHSIAERPHSRAAGGKRGVATYRAGWSSRGERQQLTDAHSLARAKYVVRRDRHGGRSGTSTVCVSPCALLLQGRRVFKRASAAAQGPRPAAPTDQGPPLQPQEGSAL